MNACYWVYHLVIFSPILAAALLCFVIPRQKLLWGDPQSYATRMHQTLMPQGHQCLDVKQELLHKDEPGKARCIAGGKHCHSERSSACCGISLFLFSPS